MDGSLTPRVHFPAATPPAAGETLAIAPGVWWLRMPLPFALDHINLWLLEDGRGWTIVDTGYAIAETTARWERIFAECLGGSPITRVIVTHHHPDHIGLAGWLAERWQASLWISEKEWLFARLLTRTDDSADLRRGFAHRAGLDAAASELFAEHYMGYRRGVPSVPSSFQRLGDGQAVEIGGRRWRVIIGEGHSPELACLYCAETGVLISGDQVLPKISPNVSVRLMSLTAIRWRGFCAHSISCVRRFRPRRSFCPRTTFHFLGCTSGSTLSPRITRRAARRSSLLANAHRAPWSCCRSCSGGPSTRIKWRSLWARRSPMRIT